MLTYIDPWAPATSPSPQTVVDPWAPNIGGAAGGARAASANGLEVDDEFAVLHKRTSDSGALNLDPLGPALLTPMNNNSGSRSNNASPTILGSGGRKKDPLEFLGENSNLVNLDNLVPLTSSSSSSGAAPGLLSTSTLGAANPFAAPAATSLLTSGSANQTVNPFQLQNQIAKPSINEIREKQQQNQLGFGGLGMSPTSVPLQPQPSRASPAINNPWSPVKTENPFLN